MLKSEKILEKFTKLFSRHMKDTMKTNHILTLVVKQISNSLITTRFHQFLERYAF
jgi:hypothetical protein